MPLRYHKQIKLGDFVKLNLNKNSMSLSAGVPGFHFNIGPQGPMVNVDLPGGLSYRQNLKKSEREQAKEEREARKTEAAQATTNQQVRPEDLEIDAPRIRPEDLEGQPAPPVADAAAAQPQPAPAEPAAVEPPPKRKQSRPKAKAKTGRVQSVFPPDSPPAPPPDQAAAGVVAAQALGSPAAAAPPPNPPGSVATVVPSGSGSAPAPSPSAPPPEQQVPPEEAPFQLGFIAYQNQDFVQAYRHFTDLVTSRYPADALLMAGITASYLDRVEEAITYLSTLLEEGQPPLPGSPESLVTRYLSGATLTIPITQFTTVNLPLDLTAALLLYVDLLERDEQPDLAITTLEDVFRQSPDFRLAQLCLGNLYFQRGRFDDIFTLFSQHTPELAAEDDIAVEIMVYWALALTNRQMFDAADKVYRRALARKKGISPDLRLLVLYGRADLYERWGKQAQARKNFEKIFAEAPDFYDVRARIAALGGVEQTPQETVSP